MNNSKFRKVTEVAIGDYVLIKNICKRLKFDPIFGPDRYKVVEVSFDRPVVTVQREKDGKISQWHLDDIKHTNQPEVYQPQRNCDVTEKMQIEESHRRCEDTDHEGTIFQSSWQ